jgi:hypothetical protein
MFHVPLLLFKNLIITIMPKIEDKSTYFEIDGAPHPKNRCRTIVSDDNVLLREVGAIDKNWTPSSHFGNWTDSTDTPYASKDDLLTAIGTICFS